jgi:hypothetical protein
MGLWNSIRTWATGYDAEAEQKRSQQLDQGLSNYNDSTNYYDRLDAQNRAAAYAHLQQQQADTATIPQQVDAGFAEGLQQGLQNELGYVRTVSDTTNEILGSLGKSIFGAIPWWFWLFGLLALFLYMGGGQFLKGRLAKA